MDLKLFLYAISGDLVALMSGIGSVVLLVLGLTTFYSRPTPRWIVLIVAAACFFFSAARVWTTEHRAREAADKQVDSLTKPQFVLDIYTSLSGDVPKKGSVLYVNLGLKNLGAPSSAYAWKLDVASQEKTMTDLSPTQIEDGSSLRRMEDNTVLATFHQNNRIEEKGLVPIGHNSFITGWLRFDIPNVMMPELKQSTVTMKVYDIAGRPYTAVVPFGPQKGYVPGYVPGSGDSVLPKDFNPSSEHH